MKLKTKLTLSISILVLLVVLAVNLIYLAGVVQQQTQQVYSYANFLVQEIYNEMSQELVTAHAGGTLKPGPAGRDQFFQGLKNSPAMTTLLSSAIGYNGAVRDVALAAPDGTVVADSNPLLEGQPLPTRRLMSGVIGNGLWREIKAVFGQDQIYAISLATQVGSQPLGTISVGVDTVLLRQEMMGRIRQMALYGLLIVLLATGMAWGLSDLVLLPLGAISAQLDQLTAAPPDPLAPRRNPDFGVVSSKIQRLGRQMEDVRQVYSVLQQNVTHVLEGLEEGLLLFDAHGRSVMASAIMPRLLGLPRGELAGLPVETLFPAAEGLDLAVRRAVREKTALVLRATERHPGGRPLLARLDLVRDGAGNTGTLLILRDAEPVYQLENELEVARRLSAVGRLTRGVAHEVKNPLNAMAIHLDLLRGKAGPEAARLAPHIQVIGREIERLDRVVRAFLDFSRPVELHLEAEGLGEMVHNVAQLVDGDASARGLRVTVATVLPGPRVWMDRDLIEQALLNLVNNGLQAMEGGGHNGGGELRLEAFEQDHQGIIRVRDQGPGVPAEDRDKIFDLYFTTRGEGTGIGLSLAARIMQLHQGAIELEPNAGGGASFLLRFPLRGELKPEATATPSPSLPAEVRA